MLKEILCAGLLACPAYAFAEDAPRLTVDDAVIFKAFESARAAGGYMTVRNAGDTPDMLTGVEVDGLMAMIHESREENGVMRMVHLDAVEIPAGGEVVFAPGGLHVMLMGFEPGDLGVGETLEATLLFDREGALEVTFEVTERPADGSGMTH